MCKVVKKEVLKLYQAGIIYLVPHSEWVSPVQVVLKKGGMTIIKNEKNELIPQRTVTGWRMCIDYQKLNKATKKDHFLLPFIDEMLERLANHTSCYPSLMKCWNGLQTTLSFVSLMGIPDITKFQSTPMTKVRPLSHPRMELTHTNECRSDCAMLQLLSNGA
jgi:hypothetical protein